MNALPFVFFGIVIVLCGVTYISFDRASTLERQVASMNCTAPTANVAPAQSPAELAQQQAEVAARTPLNPIIARRHSSTAAGQNRTASVTP